MTDFFEEESQEQLKTKWHEKRAMGIGGSDIPIVMGISPYKTPYRLWLEKTKKVKQEDISGMFHVVRGVENEPVARAMFEDQTQMKFTPKSWVIEGKEFLRCNDDGFNDEYKIVLEIKCMGIKNHIAATNGIIPKHYIYQIQYNMAISKALLGYFISYRPETKELISILVHPDLELQNELLEAAEKFWIGHVMSDVPPALSDDDYVSCLDPEFEEASEQYKKLKGEIKMLEEQMESVESVLHSYLEDSTGIKQNGITISRVVRKGNVQYDKIPELKGVNLDVYRKPSSTYIKITGE
jgi:putative phage-type endonuclease